MKLRRLLQMGPAELVFRGRQELSKRLERIGLINLSSPSGSILKKLPPEEVLDRLWQTASVRFFEGIVSAQTRALLESRMPGARESVIAVAEDIRRGRFDLLGYRGLSFGNPIDWHLDPVSDRRAPAVHWSRLNPLDAESVGDSKVIWELNRHQWLVRLAQAHAFTGDESYAQACLAAIES